MLSLNLKPIFNARGVEKPYSFLVKNGFTPHAANNLLNSHTRVFRLDHIERLCEVLICEPNDLVVWRPNAGKVIAQNNPLNKFISNANNETDLKKTLFDLPYNQLKDIAQKLTNEINENQK